MTHYYNTMYTQSIYYLVNHNISTALYEHDGVPAWDQYSPQCLAGAAQGGCPRGESLACHAAESASTWSAAHHNIISNNNSDINAMSYAMSCMPATNRIRRCLAYGIAASALTLLNQHSMISKVVCPKCMSTKCTHNLYCKLKPLISSNVTKTGRKP